MGMTFVIKEGVYSCLYPGFRAGLRAGSFKRATCGKLKPDQNESWSKLEITG